MSEKNKNYYETLEVSPSANNQEIYHAYLQAKNAYTTDSLALYSLMSQDECEKMIECIEEAYSILSDPAKRNQYNEARGLAAPQMTMSEKRRITPILDQRPTEMNAPDRAEKKKEISKIIANKRFSLEFDLDPTFEQEIEQTTVFTGETIKKIREYKNVDITRLSEMTKVSKTYIQKIESEDMNNLPALVYVRGFVYQIAKCLKVNPDLVASSYLEHLKKSQT